MTISRSFDDPAAGGPPYAGSTPDERSDAVAQLSALMAATHAQLLRVTAAVVHARDWVHDGATDPASWLVAMCGLTRDHAREWVRAALALEELPCLRAAFESGRLSWDQIRPATLFATPGSDAAVWGEIEGLSARQVGILARERRPITRPEAQADQWEQSLVLRPDHRRGGIRITGRVTAEAGATIAAALAVRAEQSGPDAATGRWDPLHRRLALALHELATDDLTAAGDPDATCVVIHADSEVIDGAVLGNGRIGDCAVPRDGVLRALCDCRVEAHLHGADGATVGIGRRGRTIPRWLRRTVHGRDGTCRFPGCERLIRQIHHIRHWSKGGPTDASNLVGLCWAHHVLVHEGGWWIEGHPDGTLTFRDRFRRWESRRDPVRTSVRTRLLRRGDPAAAEGPDG